MICLIYWIIMWIQLRISKSFLSWKIVLRNRLGFLKINKVKIDKKIRSSFKKIRKKICSNF